MDISSHSHSHNYFIADMSIARNEKKTLIVVILTGIMMIIEVISGYVTGSMALLADGWHMVSHAGALSISLVAYKLAKSENLTDRFSFGAGKFIPLGGYTSAIMLAMIAIAMAGESFHRLLAPKGIRFNEAILVATVGLVINVVCALVLSHNDQEHSHDVGGHHHVHDHNIRSAYVHIIADALTSILAIIALTAGKYFQAIWLDPVMGIVGSLVILKWAYILCRDAGWELLDGHAKSINRESINKVIEDDFTSIADMHLWRIAPKALACAITIITKKPRGPEYYHKLIWDRFLIKHLTVEERVFDSESP